MRHRDFLNEMFLSEGSFASAIPAGPDELANAFSTQDGPIPVEELVQVGNGGYVFWDNGMYVEVFVHISPGNWEAVENEGQYAQLPRDIQTQYRMHTGDDWPAPGGSLKDLAGRMGLGSKNSSSGGDRGPSN